MNRILIVVLLTVLPSVVNAFSGEVEVNGLWYDIVTKANTAKVISSKGAKYSGEITIPASIEYEGIVCNVVSIKENTFSDCSDISSITIGSNITSIGKSAFQNCAHAN